MYIRIRNREILSVVSMEVRVIKAVRHPAIFNANSIHANNPHLLCTCHIVCDGGLCARAWCSAGGQKGNGVDVGHIITMKFEYV